MKNSRVVELSEYKARRQARAQRLTKAGAVKTLPDQDHLWELLDRNISLNVWKKDN